MVRTLEEKQQTSELIELMLSKMPCSEVEKIQILELIKNGDELEQIRDNFQTSNTQAEDVDRVLNIVTYFSIQIIKHIVGDSVNISFKIGHSLSKLSISSA